MAGHKKRWRLYCVTTVLVKADEVKEICLLTRREPVGSRFYRENGLRRQRMLRHISQQRTDEFNAFWAIAQILHEFQASWAIKAVGARIAL